MNTYGYGGAIENKKQKYQKRTREKKRERQRHDAKHLTELLKNIQKKKINNK